MVLLFGELMSELRPTTKNLPHPVIVVWETNFKVLTYGLQLTF